ncbi:MAG: hypothetical protein PHV74_15855 [Dehalococcoidia bacterium]|nr:hypothetical protein [Dehalococcoidia bacterium]
MKDTLVRIAFYCGMSLHVALLTTVVFVLIEEAIFAVFMALGITGMLALVVSALLPPTIAEDEETKTHGKG